MTFFDLSIFENLRTSTDAYSNSKLIDFDITSDAQHLADLKLETNQLQKTLTKEQKSLTKKKDENSFLTDLVGTFPQEDNFDPRSDSFFHRLRSYEAEYERLDSEKDGLKSTINNTKNQINSIRHKNQRCKQKISELQDQLNATNNRKQHYIDILANANSSHCFVSEKVTELENECELIKSNIKEKAEQLKRISPKDVEFLHQQKLALEQEIEKSQLALTDIKKRERQQKTKLAIAMKKQKNVGPYQYNTSNWMSERVNYLGKIKKMREEKISLQKFEKSNQRMTEMNEKQKEMLNFTEDEIKSSIIAEMRTFVFVKSEFYEDTMETEKEYTEELKEELRDINQSMAEILQFRSSTLDMLKRQEEIATISDRIGILTEELTDIRSELM